MFTNFNKSSLRSLAVALSMGAGICGSEAQAAKERVTGPIFNGDVVGTNANQFYFELIGNDKFYSWGATNAANVLLFNGGNAGGVNSVTAPFAGANVLGNGAGMTFDTIRDTGGKITRKAGVGVTKVSTLQIAGVRDVVTKIDPLNKTVRKAVNLASGTSDSLEIVLTNESDDPIQVNSLSMLVNNIDDPLDFSTPFVPDGTLASLDQPFLAQSLSPGASLMFTYSGSYDENMPIAVMASSIWGGDSFNGTLGTYVNPAVPEPGSLGLAMLGAIPLLRRQRSKPQTACS